MNDAQWRLFSIMFALEVILLRLVHKMRVIAKCFVLFSEITLENPESLLSTLFQLVPWNLKQLNLLPDKPAKIAETWWFECLRLFCQLASIKVENCSNAPSRFLQFLLSSHENVDGKNGKRFSSSTSCEAGGNFLDQALGHFYDLYQHFAARNGSHHLLLHNLVLHKVRIYDTFVLAHLFELDRVPAADGGRHHGLLQAKLVHISAEKARTQKLAAHFAFGAW